MKHAFLFGQKYRKEICFDLPSVFLHEKNQTLRYKMAGVQFSGITVPIVLVLLNRELVGTFYMGGLGGWKGSGFQRCCNF